MILIKQEMRMSENNSDMSNSNLEWTVKEDRVKIGTEWKSAKQLKKSFILELFAAIVFGALCIYAFTINILLGVVILFGALFFILIAMGSISALRAVDEKVELKSKRSFKDRIKTMRKKLEPKAVIETVSVLETNLINTANKQRQAIIGNIEKEMILLINTDYTVTTKDEDVVGDISKSDIAKINTFSSKEENIQEFKCKVLSIEKNASDKHIVNVEVLAIK